MQWLVVLTNTHLLSTNPEVIFFTGEEYDFRILLEVWSVLKICGKENLYQLSWLDLRFNVLLWSTTTSTHLHHHHLHYHHHHHHHHHHQIPDNKQQTSLKYLYPSPADSHSQNLDMKYQLHPRSIQNIKVLYFKYESKIQHHRSFLLLWKHS